MRIVVIGSTGTIGSAVVKQLSAAHQVVGGSRKSNPPVDITNAQTLQAFFDKSGQVDGVICCAGDAKFAPLTALTDDDLGYSLRNKLMGQVNVVRMGLPKVKDKGFFVLTSGIFSTRPWPGVPAVALVNGAIDSFVRAAALDLPRGIRINVVSPPFIEETAAQMGMAGKGGATAATAARAYVSLIEGSATGQIIEV